MLVLCRKKGEQIVIGEGIQVTVLVVKGGRVRLGIEAPNAVSVHRKEVYDKIHHRAAEVPAGQEMPLRALQPVA